MVSSGAAKTSSSACIAARLYTRSPMGWRREKGVAAIQELAVIEKILRHLGLEPQPPSKGPARKTVQHHAG